jgi:uncharacterized protein (DUF2141 family)
VGIRVARISSLAAVAAFVSMLASAQASELTITITGAGPTGRVLGKVFGDAASFRSKENAVAAFAVDPANGRAVALVHDLAPAGMPLPYSRT